MANRAALIRAENSGRSVTRRGRNFIEFDLGNGQRRYVTTIEPLHKRDEVTEIDATWVADTGAWQWKLASVDFGVNARSALNAGDVVQWTHTASGENVVLQPLDLSWVDNVTDSRQQISIPQAVTAQANDCTLTWANGFGTGRHFRYVAHPRRLIKEFIVDAASNLPAPTVSNPYLEVQFYLKASTGLTLYVDGTAWDRSTKRNTANRIEFRVTATGETAFWFEAPTAYDANGETTPGIMQLRRSGANRYVTVRFPQAWLDAATFPVVLDPTFTDGYGGDVTTSKDTYLGSSNTDKSYGGEPTINNSSSTIPGLIQFDLSSIPAGSTCNSATLSFWNTATKTSNRVLSFYELKAANASWLAGASADPATNNQSTWDYRNQTGSGSGTAWAGSAGAATADTDYSSTVLGTMAYTANDPAGTEDTASFTAASVATWFGSPNTNYGLRFIATTGGSYPELAASDHATTGYRPKLVVDYTAGGATTYPFWLWAC